MLIRLKKLRDGVVLACIRGGARGGRREEAAVQRTGHNGFFAFHDLMHYATETTLGLDQAFFGLMASGWDFANFTRHDDPNYRPLPPQAVVAEHLVGTLTRHHRDATRDPDLLRLLADEVNQDLAASLSTSGIAPPTLTVDQIIAIYARFEDLVRRWAAVDAGDHLELEFPAPAQCPVVTA